MPPEAMAPIQERKNSTSLLASARTGTVAQTIIANGATMGLGALGSVLAARALGPAGRGDIAAIFVWVALATAIGDLGISQGCIYYGAKTRGREGAIVGTALALGISIAIAVSCCLQPFRIRLFGDALAAPAALYLFSIPLGVATTYLGATLQGMNRMGAFNLVRIVQAAAYPVGVALAILFGRPRVGPILYLIFACQCCATATALLAASRVLPPAKWRLTKEAFRSLVGYGTRAYPGNIFWMANGRLDQALLSLFAPRRELGIYAVAVSYSSILFGLAGAFASVAFPRLASAPSLGAARKEIRAMLRILVLFTIPLGILMAGTSFWLLPYIFGRAFSAGVEASCVLLAGGVLLSINFVLATALRATGRPGAPVFAELGALVVTASALPFALPRWGITGAAWVSVVAYGVSVLGLALLWNRPRRAPMKHAATT